MNPRLVEYYNRELAYLRELGAEFAAAFPKVAGRLSLRDNEVADPYVERLLEGFSFLSARIHMKMDAEFPRFSQRILDMVCPHYLAPTPSMMVAQVEPSSTEGNLVEGYRMPAGSVLRSRKTEDAAHCDFRTGHELTLWPVDLVRARLSGPPMDLPLSRLSLPKEPGGHLRLDLTTRAGLQFGHIHMDRLDLFISAVDSVASHLQELLHQSLLGIVVHDAKDPSRVFGFLGPEALRAEGYDSSQALLPYSRRAFQGHRLLHEYFAFPARFRFFSIRGLREIFARAPVSAISLTLLLQKAQPSLESQVDHRKFLLHCVPAINLFERVADRIHVAPNVHEYHVVLDRTRSLDYEVYAVTSVTGHEEGEVAEREFVPLYAAVHGIRPEDQAYFVVRREPRLFSETTQRFGPRTRYLGSEAFLSLVDQRAAPISQNLKQLTVVTQCTNRDLPLLIPTHRTEGDFTTVESAPVGAIRVVAGPSRPVDSLADNEITWRLISHLSINYLAMTDRSEEEGAATLRDLLSLYLSLGDRDLSGQVAGLKTMTMAPITRRMPQHRPMVYGRGVGVEIGVDEVPFAGVSPWPLMAILEQFFALHVGVNSFTEISAHSRQRGKIGQWAVRPGRRPNL